MSIVKSLAVAAALQKQGRRIVGIGILDHADPELANYCEEFDWIGIGGIGRGGAACPVADQIDPDEQAAIEMAATTATIEDINFRLRMLFSFVHPARWP